MLKYAGPSAPTKNKNVKQESYKLITTKQTVHLAPPDLHASACRKNGGTLHSLSKGRHTAQPKYDFQNILGCARLSDLVKTKKIEHKAQRERKIQLTMAINYISSKPNSNETRIMHARSDNVEIMMGSETDEVIEELFKSLRQRYKKKLEKAIKGSEFIFDGVNALYYDLNTVSLSRGRSYIDSPEWLKNKKTTINTQNEKDGKCFQYALTVALNYKQIKKDPQRVSKIKPVINQYN